MSKKTPAANAQDWAYARVSSEEQVKGVSIDSQTRRLQDAGIPPDRIVVEVGSASKNRTPALKRLYARAKRGEVRSITAIRQDRLQRSRRGQADLWQLVDEHGVIFKFLDQPDINPNDPSSCFQAGILGAAAQYETAQLSQRTKNAINQNRLKLQHHGPAPFGYTKYEKRLVPHPEEWSIARQVIEHYLSTGSSTQARKLRHQLTGSNRAPSVSSFARWLLSPTLRGAIVFDAKGEQPEIHWQQHEALISAAEWDQIQAIRKRNRTSAGAFRKASAPTIGTGLLLCGHCGGMLTHTVTKRLSGVRDLYRCSSVKGAGCELGHTNWIKRQDVAQIIRRCIALAAAQIAEQTTPLNAPEPIELQALRQERDALRKVGTVRALAMAQQVEQEIAETLAALRLSDAERQEQVEQEFCRLASEKVLQKLNDEQLRSLVLRYGLQVRVDQREPVRFKFERLSLMGVLG